MIQYHYIAMTKILNYQYQICVKIICYFKIWKMLGKLMNNIGKF